VPTACFPGARLGGLTRFAGWYGSYHGRYAKVPVVHALHPHGVAMHHLIRIVGMAARNGAAARRIGSGGEPDNVEDELARPSCVGSFLELTAGQLRPNLE
jgi:hypothetical protein